MKLYAISDRNENESIFFYAATNAKEAKKAARTDCYVDCDFIDLRCKWIRGIDLNLSTFRHSGYNNAQVLFWEHIPDNVKEVLRENGFYKAR